MVPEAALALCRFAHDVSAMLLWGAFGYLAALVPRDLASDVTRRLTVVRTSTIVLAVLTTAAMLPIEVAAIGDGWGDVIDPAMVRAVLFETSVGTAWQVRAVLALLLLATLFAPVRARVAATATGSGLLVAALALTGHAVMHQGRLGLAHRLNDAAHVLAGGAWLGALLPLLAILKALDDPLRRIDAGVALRRFSTAGHGAVVLVIATGVANTALILRRWPTDWSSPYQALLSGKIALVLVMTALAIVNRYVLVPRMAARRTEAVDALRFGTITEIGLGVAAIGCVSVFGLLEPAAGLP